jgi:hypothetical protein
MLLKIPGVACIAFKIPFWRDCLRTLYIVPHLVQSGVEKATMFHVKCLLLSSNVSRETSFVKK